MLKDKIEMLIRLGHLGRFLRRQSHEEQTHEDCDLGHTTNTSQGSINTAHGEINMGDERVPIQDLLQEVQGKINTFFGGPNIGGTSRRSQGRFTHEAQRNPLTNALNLNQRPPKSFRRENEPITITEDDALKVHYPYNNPLVVTA